MNKSAKSLLLVTMMAVSGFAVAQTAAPSAPTNDVKSGTQGGSGPSASEKAATGGMPASRAEVKSQAEPMKSGIQGGSGATPSTNPNTSMSGAKGMSDSRPMASGDRKMTNAERRAANKANRAKRASTAGGQKEGKSAL